MDVTARPAPAALLRTAALFVSYLVAAVLGEKVIRIGAVAPVWPASGIAILGLYLLGLRAAPVILLADIAGNWLAGPAPFHPLVALGTAGANVAEAAVAVLILRALSFDMRLRRLDDVGALSLAALAGACVGASLGIGVLIAGGSASLHGAFVSSAAHGWRSWSCGDLIGDLAVVPLYGVWSTMPQWGARRTECLAGLAGLAAASVIVFSARAGALYLLFPFLVWAPMRTGRHGTTLAVAMLAAVSVAQTAGGHGPFARADRVGGIVSLQLFLGVVILTELAFAVLRHEREEVVREEAALAAELSDSAVHELMTACTFASSEGQSGLAALDEVSRELEGALSSMRFLTGVRCAVASRTSSAQALVSLFVLDARRRHPELTVELVDELAGEVALGPYTASSCARVLRAALRDAAHHAHVSALRVRLFADGAALCLEVSDDGSGFASGDGPEEPFRVIGLREPAEAAGGHLELRSVRGQAASVLFRMPERRRRH